MKAYTDRNLYRRAIGSTDLVSFQVVIRETDLMVLADRDLTREVYASTLRHRLALEGYLREHPDFAASFAPLPAGEGDPGIVRLMALAAAAAGVGPMAAVAGAVAECVGEDMRGLCATVIIENGGDLYISSPQPRTVGLYAGDGPGEFHLGLRVDASMAPVGICTSSGVIGPSFSGGRARAATVVASSSALADAAATGLGNRLRNARDLEEALAWVGTVPGVSGAVAVVGKTFGAWGDLDLVQLRMDMTS